MNKITTLLTIMGLAMAVGAQADFIEAGDVIGIDFGTVGNSSSFNTYAAGSDTIATGSVSNTLGTVMDGISFKSRRDDNPGGTANGLGLNTGNRVAGNSGSTDAGYTRIFPTIIPPSISS